MKRALEAHGIFVMYAFLHILNTPILNIEVECMQGGQMVLLQITVPQQVMQIPKAAPLILTQSAWNPSS